MGKRVLAAFDVVAPMGGVFASGLSAATTSADASASASASSIAERTGSCGEDELRALYRQPVAEGGWCVVSTGAPPRERSAPGSRQAVPEPAAVRGCAGVRNRARTDLAPPAGRNGICDHTTKSPPGLGQLVTDRAALDRYEARLRLSTGDEHGAHSSGPTS
ncbi:MULTISPECIES: hypothetical protein [unclassified Streptomyces]|uniref:hypothetical protein n=1 Tax=unclassified Streptomyces TaxID=2593676 RepID=UPI00403C34D9